ncbi:SDR family NAD(P)-dependent oxidoreductase [Pelagibacterium lacus]|uniref:SDR family NAD(P)-dependent oxidoreductase n=1 Tax=Pelagibacterium lacus TaxID=2282655 RepID=A0A369W4A6_9HYPH|nr:SDR family oxidoreductase [Pelagibacterium lacus]RDE08705.1 SDR family NAD(P)-dependent oxidoreductase [Pelagibacterium lacus]
MEHQVMRLKNKTAVVTGGASGIGRASAIRLSAEGAKILVADISERAGMSVAEEIRDAGHQATFLKVDMAKEDEISAMIDKAVSLYGSCDILFNNAGVAGESLENTTPESLRRVIDINLNGPFFACMYAIPVMKKQGGGVIINTGSIGGIKSSGRSPAYAASKGGLLLATRTFARIAGGDNIRVNAVCPGSVDTEQTIEHMGNPSSPEGFEAAQARRLSRIPLGRAATADDIAKAVVFLASDEAAYITGESLVVDGGVLA